MMQKDLRSNSSSPYSIMSLIINNSTMNSTDGDGMTPIFSVNQEIFSVLRLYDNFNIQDNWMVTLKCTDI